MFVIMLVDQLFFPYKYLNLFRFCDLVQEKYVYTISVLQDLQKPFKVKTKFKPLVNFQTQSVFNEGFLHLF